MRRSSLTALLAAAASACTETPPAGLLFPDAAAALCSRDEDCADPAVCRGGVCVDPGAPDAGGDARAELEVCTDSGCAPPYEVNLGGSRVGVEAVQTVVVRSVGTAPVELRNVELITASAELSCDPQGQVDVVLAPGQSQAIRVRHVASDGVADTGQLEIISSARTSRVLVAVRTEYKGVPSLRALANPRDLASDATLLDFGQVELGTTATRTLYLLNVDPVIDGSVLTVERADVDPPTSTRFGVALGAPLPAHLNQYDGFCATDANCRAVPGDACDPALGVCRRVDGVLRDLLAVTVTFSAHTAGPAEERLLVLSNDGGQRGSVRVVVLRARATVRDLDITPDPIDLSGAFVGYPARRAVTLSNGGSADLVVSGLSVVGGAPFALDQAPALPLTLAPGATRSFEVTYSPTAAGVARDSLRVDSDDAHAPVQLVSITGTASIAPRLELSVSQVDFGDTHVAAGATVELTARNSGGSTLIIPSITTTGTIPFSANVLGFPSRLAPGASARFTVAYRPRGTTYPNAETGQLRVLSNDPAEQPALVVPLRGRGIAPRAAVFPPGAVTFNTLPQNPVAPNIYVGQAVTAQLLLLNTGSGPLIVSGASVQNDARGSFVAAVATPLPIAIEGGQSVTVDVVYSTPLAGTDGGELVLDTNDAAVPGGVVRVQLIGSTIGCNAPPGAVGTYSVLERRCTFACAPNQWDLDGDLAAVATNGCEYACNYLGAVDLPDAQLVDADCDGLDGQRAQAVFVSPVGDDGDDGLTAGQAKRTIAAGIAAAQATGRYVVVAAGTYTSPTVQLADGVDVYGGYDPLTWGRSPANVTEILHDNVPVNGVLVAVRGSGLTQETIVDRVQIRTQDAQVAAVGNYAVHCTACPGLRLTRALVRAGAAGAGLPGIGGAAGANGSGGSDGANGSCSGAAAAGGPGGGSACGRTGGGGGNGGNRGSNTGQVGGIGVVGTPGGAGGRGGDPGRAGVNGTGGAGGTFGASGGGGSGGAIVGDAWRSSAGTAGLDGSPGNGGGGGGGGGGQGCFPCSDAGGNGGGGGGAGGCGGGGGAGGAGGGASFGVLLLASAGARVEECAVSSGAGGAGGSGGSGGPGGGGGAPGAGGTGCLSDIGMGGAGGSGGPGGGGGHGGGGAGGPSFAIYRDDLGVVLVGNLLTPGSGGAGGPSAGSPGAPGASGPTN